MPNFLNPIPALIAAAMAVPLLLLLYFLKLRRRDMPVSSTLLWRKAVQDLQVNAPFHRLRRNLLLLLQMLLLAALLLALARPVINYTPGAGQITVILIDRSASMSATDAKGKTRLDDAKARANRLVDMLGRGASAMVIAFDEQPQIVRSFTSDRSALKAGIDSIQPTDRRSRLKLAFQLAEAQATNFNPDQRRPNTEPPEVYLFSDGRVLDGDESSLQRSKLTWEKLGTDQAANIGIVALSAKRNYEQPSEVQVFARLANYGPNPVEADVQLSVEGLVKVARVLLLPEHLTPEQREKLVAEKNLSPRDSVEFTLDLLTSAVIKVEQMNRQDDVLSADDAAYVVVPPPRALSVLLVTPPDGNYFLENAFDALKLQKKAKIVGEAFDEQMKDPDKVASQYDVIIFDRYQPKALPPTGNFLYFATVPPGTKVKAVMDEDKLALAKEVMVLDWDRDHPLLRHMRFSNLYAGEMLRLERPPETQVLMEGMKGPMMVLHREGRSVHLVVTFDPLQSNWPFKVTFPIFIDRAMQFLAIGTEMDVRQSYSPGASPRIPASALVAAGAGRTVHITGPGGWSRTAEVPAAGDFALPALDHVGIYSLEPPPSQYEKIAVNLLDENESNVRPAEAVPGGGGAPVVAEAGKARLDLWWWVVACGAIPLCLLEWWVYARRVHL